MTKGHKETLYIVIAVLGMGLGFCSLYLAEAVAHGPHPFWALYVLLVGGALSISGIWCLWQVSKD